MDTFDELAQKWFSCNSSDSLPGSESPKSPFRRVIMFVDNAGQLGSFCVRWKWAGTACLCMQPKHNICVAAL